MNRRFKKLIAFVCAIALVVTSITVYNVKTASAADYSGLSYVDINNNNNNEFSAALKGSQIAVAEGALTLNVSQYQNAGFSELYLAVSGISAANLVVTANGKTVETEGTGIRMYNAAEVLTYEYNVIDIKFDGGSGVIIVHCPANAGNGTYGEGGGETTTADPDATTAPETTTVLQKPGKVMGLVATINDIKTNYTIAFSSIVGSKYNLYIDGIKYGEIANGGILVIADAGLQAGKEYSLQVSAFNAAGEGELSDAVKVTIPGAETETTTAEAGTTVPAEEFDPSTITDWTAVANSSTLSYYVADNMGDKVTVKPQVENGSSVYIAYNLAAQFKSVTLDTEVITPEPGAFVRLDLAKFTEGYHKLVVENYYGNESVTIYFKADKVEETTTAAPIADGTEILKNVEFNGNTNWAEDGVTDAVNGGDGTVSFGVPAKDGGDAWSSQLVQNGITLENGKWYVAKYVVTSDVDKNFRLLIQSDGNAGGDWSEFAAYVANVKAGQEVEVTLKFQAAKAANANALMGIMMGYIDATASEAANVKISAISLKGYSAEPEVMTGSVVIKEPTVVKHTVTVDGVATEVEENSVYILGDATYGYYADGKMYKAGTEITVTSDMTFTSVNTLSVTMANGAGIRYQGTAGIRFQAAVVSDNAAALADQSVIKEGTLITAEDIYEANGSSLTLTSAGTKVNVKNTGWYNDSVGTYCGSLCNIVESNYIREFTAVGYVTVEYADGTSTTVYSAKGPVRSISQVATAVKADGYRGIDSQYHSVIDSFIK